MKWEPYKYQKFAYKHVLDHPSAGLLIDMGLGKTAIVLTAILELMKVRGEVKKVLIIAPLSVAEHTWNEEIEKWDHLRSLTISNVIGNTPKKRLTALNKQADIYITNKENVQWLCAHYQLGFPFDMVVVDESSAFKDPDSKRFKAFRIVRPLVKRVVILTGTPTPNGLVDLWSQIYMLDRGERLGTSVGDYRRQYFRPNKQNGNIVYSYKIRTPDKEDDLADIKGKDYNKAIIYEKIGDICISMKSEDYLDLPDLIENVIDVQMTPEVFKKYKEFEKELVLDFMNANGIQDANAITAANAAVLSNKLLQLANGAVYDREKVYHVFHDNKLDHLEEILEEANGKPVLVFYSFQSDVDRIFQRFKKYKPFLIKGKAAINKWNSGEHPLAVAHPKSAGHGLNLQHGGHIMVWFGLNWSLELFQQAVKRLHRNGQLHNVIMNLLLCRGTVDYDVKKALTVKADGQNELLNAVKVKELKKRVADIMQQTFHDYKIDEPDEESINIDDLIGVSKAKVEAAAEEFDIMDYLN